MRKCQKSVCALAEKSVAHSDVQPGDAMKGYVHSIEKAALKNKTFRTVLYTAKNCQLVVMSSSPVKISARRYTSSISFSG